MQDSIRLELMTTSGCHLCEQAAQKLQYMAHQEPQLSHAIDIVEVEISESAALVEQYGVRIPVIKMGNSELGWPFDYEDLLNWINSQIARR
jgi:glutaredoxin